MGVAEIAPGQRLEKRLERLRILDPPLDGTSVVLVTHDNRILDVADRILNLEDGRVQSLSEAVAGEAGRMLDILSQYDPEAHHQLIAFALAMARVAQADRHVAPEEVEVIRAALKDAATLGEGEIDFVMHLVLSHSDNAFEAGSHLKLLDSEQRDRLRTALHAVGEADGNLTSEERSEIDLIIAQMDSTT